MNPLGTRARSEELAGLLDGGGYPGSAARGAGAAPYVAVAGRLQVLGADLGATVTPRAEFRSALRTRLVAVAAVSAVNAQTAAPPSKGRALESAVSWSQTRRAQRGIGLAAGAMASVVAVAGVAVAGSQSLPGDPFYSVKRGAEALQLRTTDGAVGKGSKQLAFAAERLKEVRELSLGRDAAFGGSSAHPLAGSALGGSASSRIRDALADMDNETRIGSNLLTAAYRSTNSDAPLQILSGFAGRQSSELTGLLPSLPSAARLRAEDSLALVSYVAVQASQLLAVGVCTGQCAPSQAAPSLPPATGGPRPAPAPRATTDAPCGCQSASQPTRTAAPAPATSNPGASPQSTATAPTPAPSPASASASPKPHSSSPAPLPVPVPATPTPLPSLPVPLPSIAPSPLSTLTGAVQPAVPTLPLH
ncbi:MAG: hypothetical protein NVSMB55_16040 [Mycobacteriales bacterium]